MPYHDVCFWLQFSNGSEMGFLWGYRKKLIFHYKQYYVCRIERIFLTMSPTCVEGVGWGGKALSDRIGHNE